MTQGPDLNIHGNTIPEAIQSKLVSGVLLSVRSVARVFSNEIIAKDVYVKRGGVFNTTCNL
jgi:hypothetical protein